MNPEQAVSHEGERRLSSILAQRADSDVGWRLVVTGPAPGAWNMAVDECLMESVRAGGAPTLRFYAWSPRCLSFGRNQPAIGAYTAERLQDFGIDAVRRRTGGRAVLHDQELTYSVVAPSRLIGRARTAYHSINETIRQALCGLGVRTELQNPTSAHSPLPSLIPCFENPLPGEVLLGGRKLVGSAQVHERGVLLQHGSILLRRSARIEELESGLGVALEGGAAYLADVLSEERDVDDRVRQGIAEAWAARVGPLRRQPLTLAEERRTAELAEFFGSPGWTWRA